MKLYYSPGSCSLAPHIVLEELLINSGQPYETKLVSSMDGSTQTKEYLGINPKGRVPALDIGGIIITEAPAIMIYLAQTNTGSDLLDGTPIKIARAIEWMNWLSSSVHALPVAQNWRTERFSDDQACYQSIQEKGMGNLRSSYLQLEEKLSASNSKWTNGDSYSIVDPYLLVFYRWGNRLGLEMKTLYPVWTEHAFSMLDRKAVVNVLDHEGISIWE